MAGVGIGRDSRLSQIIQEIWTNDRTVGSGMEGGTIVITGDVEGIVGDKMIGGRIEIDGDFRIGQFISGVIVDKKGNRRYKK
jgi:formylmethanofuran dehydrogenase subunit C